MAEVFLARQRGPEGFDRRVAVKRILPHLVETGDFVRMFMDEARLAARLSHPNVVHIYEFGRVGEYWFIAMEFVDGVDASRLISSGKQQRVPPEIVARIGADACSGLHHAHTLTGADGRPLGLVHRDVSPQNLLVTYDGVVKIVDFGIAKATMQAEQTRPGVVKGKFAYMSPEQTTGKPLDGRSDVFSLGLVLWEMLAGRVAVQREDPVEAMKTIRDGKLPRIEEIRRDVPTGLAHAIGRALAKSRDDRPNAAQLGMELEAYLKSAARIATSMVVAEWIRGAFPKEPSASGPHPRLEEGTRQATQATQAASGGTAAATTSNERPDATELDAERGAHTAIAPPALVAAPARRRRWLIPAAIGAALAGAATVLAIGLSPSRSAPEKPPPPPTEPGPIVVPRVVDGGAVPIIVAREPARDAAPPPAAFGSLDVTTKPPGATVWLDDTQLADRTPLHAPDLRPGPHTVRVTLEGYLDATRTFDLVAGERRSIELALEARPKPRQTPRASTGLLSVRTIPWSDVYLGARKLGTTPLAEIELPVGSHTLTFRNPDVGTVKRRVRITGGKTTKLSLTLGK